MLAGNTKFLCPDREPTWQRWSTSWLATANRRRYSSPKIVTFLFWHESQNSNSPILAYSYYLFWNYVGGWLSWSHGAAKGGYMITWVAKGGFMITWAATSLLRGKHMSFREPLFFYKRRPLLHMKVVLWELLECKIGWSIEDASRLIVTIPIRRLKPLSGSFPVDVAIIGEPRISCVKFSTLSLSSLYVIPSLVACITIATK